MKFLPTLFFGIAVTFLSSCSTPPKPNYQQATESDLAETTELMISLRVLDSGDSAKTRQLMMVPVFLSLDSFRYYTTKGMIVPTPEQRQNWAKVAKETLDYMLKHRGEWDSRLLDVRAGIRGLRYILTAPQDVRRLDELSKDLASVEAERRATQKP